MSTDSHISDRQTSREPDVCETWSSDAGTVRRVRREIGDLDAVASLLGVLADPTRLVMLSALTVQPLCVCELAELADVSSSAASHQLRFLRDQGVVEVERYGRRAVYSLADDAVREVLSIVSQHRAPNGDGGVE
jgi:ArsR family transcriptional regulator